MWCPWSVLGAFHGLAMRDLRARLLLAKTAYKTMKLRLGGEQFEEQFVAFGFEDLLADFGITEQACNVTEELGVGPTRSFGGKRHDEDTRGLAVETFKVDFTFGDPDASQQLFDGIGFHMGHGDAVLHAGGHFGFVVEQILQGEFRVFDLAGAAEYVEQGAYDTRFVIAR